ncbi:hypothetical protein SPRG_04804 [Saprolegnia parasitica CBS 223.65]|uniref:Uncharacterized protein n=1 Tax=Saprolegnia parasitica (strain CBS 223.65) TaxID=695850 RepID=A0A067CWJ3_SAPPC|nr:hypothetical protein SPRG_04804 [Saprolegnia parasitica CBS 223.65]KDO30901.1 hypothetical protein SPRG_04804 [Saprolegnia parasitica CBS 223.65]|eukprot:XP_012198594.1 hypothetical protein SPRG_04804 [Saprolegnia parasitica CBS 223.65]
MNQDDAAPENDDDGLELLQRARLLVQAATNLPDFSTLFSKIPPPPILEDDDEEMAMEPPKTTKVKPKKAAASNQDEVKYVLHSSRLVGRTCVSRHDKKKTAKKPKEPQRETPSHPQYAPSEYIHDLNATVRSVKPVKSSPRSPKTVKPPKPKVKKEVPEAPIVDDADQKAAQELARKYAQERAAARVAAKQREKLKEAEKQQQTEADCVSEFYETLDEREKRLKEDRRKAKERARHRRQQVQHEEPVEAKPEKEIHHPDLDKFQQQTKERLLRAKEQRRREEELKAQQAAKELEEKLRHQQEDEEAQDELKRRADQLRKETRRRLKAMEKHKSELERKEMELRQQGLERYKHHKGEMERVAKGIMSHKPKDESTSENAPPMEAEPTDPVVEQVDSPTRAPPVEEQVKLQTAPDECHGEDDDDGALGGATPDVHLPAIVLPPLVDDARVLPQEKPVPKPKQKAAPWKRPPVPMPSADAVASRAKLPSALPGGPPLPPPRDTSYSDRLKSRSAPASLGSSDGPGQRLVSATRDRANQMDAQAKKMLAPPI